MAAPETARAGVVSTLPPSGEQVVIEAARHRVTVVEVGGGLRDYTLAGHQVLDPYAVDEMASSGRGQVLMPWPNRLRDGRYDFDGHSYQVPINEPEMANAIHGLVRWVAWTPRERGPDRVVMEHVLQPSPGYPFRLRLRIDYSVSADGLRVATSVTNLGATACPFGAGAHPWLNVGTSTVDTATLRVPARQGIWTDERQAPRLTAPVDGTELDFREPHRIGSVAIDNGYTDLIRDPDGLARVELAAPDGAAITLWVDGGYPYLMLSTGDVLPDVDRRSIAIEPMTCPPNALQTGDALIRLEPGETFHGSWGITPH